MSGIFQDKFGKWKVTRKYGRKEYYFGYFDSEENAKRAHDIGVFENKMCHTLMYSPDSFPAQQLKLCSKCNAVKSISDFSIVIRKWGCSLGRTKTSKKCKDCRGQTKKQTAVKQATMEYRKTFSGFWNFRMSQIKSRALKKGIVFKLDADWAKNKFLDQNGKCFYCGCEMKYGAGNGHLKNGVTIDRTDSSLGYLEQNAKLVCWVCNAAKNDMHEDDFIRMCSMVSAKFSK